MPCQALQQAVKSFSRVFLTFLPCLTLNMSLLWIPHGNQTRSYRSLSILIFFMIAKASKASPERWTNNFMASMVFCTFWVSAEEQTVAFTTLTTLTLEATILVRDTSTHREQGLWHHITSWQSIYCSQKTKCFKHYHPGKGSVCFSYNSHPASRLKASLSQLSAWSKCTKRSPTQAANGCISSPASHQRTKQLLLGTWHAITTVRLSLWLPASLSCRLWVAFWNICSASAKKNIQ